MRRGDQIRQKIIEFVRRWRKNHHGASPTIREIADGLKFSSPNAINFHLKHLEKSGVIQRDSRRSRSIRIVDDPSPNDDSDTMRGIPLLGKIAAGKLHEAVSIDESLDMSQLFDSDRHFVLRVNGDSMVDAHILDGDLVVVRQQSKAVKGSIAVVQTDDGEATLKYWFPEKNRIRLQPANRRMKPIYVRSAQVRGVVVGIIRRMR